MILTRFRLAVDPLLNVYNPEKEKSAGGKIERPFYGEEEDDEYETQFELIHQELIQKV